MWIALLLLSLLMLAGGYRYLSYTACRRRAQLIDHYQFPEKLQHTLKTTYPHLKDQDIDDVLIALREYFHLCNTAGKKMVSMPSQVVDVAWHEFILFTRKYEQFCKHALGRFLHHTPAEAMRTPTQAQQGIKTAWKIACQRENINPHTPARLPLLFAIDQRLQIPNGFYYLTNCQMASGSSSDGFCASHISSCGSADSDDGCTGDCGGGCGGD